jgi:hypothetical protein
MPVSSQGPPLMVPSLEILPGWESALLFGAL